MKKNERQNRIYKATAQKQRKSNSVPKINKKKKTMKKNDKNEEFHEILVFSETPKKKHVQLVSFILQVIFDAICFEIYPVDE